jgi:PleD family two-component response regulator
MVRGREPRAGQTWKTFIKNHAAQIFAVDFLTQTTAFFAVVHVFVVLVIEDAADSLRDVLEFGEHRVEVAHSGPAGLEKAREFQPEVVICDIGLPGMSGYKVAGALRGDEVLPCASRKPVPVRNR